MTVNRLLGTTGQAGSNDGSSATALLYNAGYEMVYDAPRNKLYFTDGDYVRGGIGKVRCYDFATDTVYTVCDVLKLQSCTQDGPGYRQGNTIGMFAVHPGTGDLYVQCAIYSGPTFQNISVVSHPGAANTYVGFGDPLYKVDHTTLVATHYSYIGPGSHMGFNGTGTKLYAWQYTGVFSQAVLIGFTPFTSPVTGKTRWGATFPNEDITSGGYTHWDGSDPLNPRGITFGIGSAGGARVTPGGGTNAYTMNGNGSLCMVDGVSPYPNGMWRTEDSFSPYFLGYEWRAGAQIYPTWVAADARGPERIIIGGPEGGTATPNSGFANGGGYAAGRVYTFGEPTYDTINPHDPSQIIATRGGGYELTNTGYLSIDDYGFNAHASVCYINGRYLVARPSLNDIVWIDPGGPQWNGNVHGNKVR